MTSCAQPGVAKGTFYLYFDSKDQIVDAVAARMVDQVGDAVEAAAVAAGLDAVARVLSLGAAMAEVGRSPHELDLIEIFHRPENRAVHDRMAEAIIGRLAPALERIVADGVADGSFRAQDAGWAAAFVLGSYSRLHDVVAGAGGRVPGAGRARRVRPPGPGLHRGDRDVSELVIRTTGLSKQYRGGVLAVDRVDLRVAAGEIYAFLGLNGAGKSTTIRMLLGMIAPTAGRAEVLGQRVRADAAELWRRVGHLVETATAYPELTVREDLDVSRRLHGVRDRGYRRAHARRARPPGICRSTHANPVPG